MERIRNLASLWHYRLLLLGGIIYGLFFFSSKNIENLVPAFVGEVRVDTSALFWFSFIWTGATLLFFYLLLRRKLIIEWKLLYLYVAMMAMIGPIGELFINSLCRFLFDSSLWTYVVYPIHGGNTSLYSALFIWPYYGFYLYFLHQKIEVNVTDKGYYIKPALFMAFDAITLEFLVNISSIIFLDTLVFYYFPNDIAHLTTIAAAPFYFLGGVVVTRTIKRFKADPIFFGTMSLLIAFTFVFLVS